MKKNQRSKILTIPNMLTFIRLCLIPLFAHLYLLRDEPKAACTVLLISGATDILDGFIARRLRMTSDLGKILDPVADKLTQAVTLFCLAGRFPMMLTLLGLLVVKELSGALLCFLAIKSSGQIQSALWHGKLNTVLLYGMLMLHLIWPDMPPVLSGASIGASLGAMLFSALMYAADMLALMKKYRKIP